jgi:hypothetical protein
MSTEARDITGRCLCGSITFRAHAAPMLQGACHCEDCQRQTGSAVSVFVAVPRSALTVEGDTLASYTVTGEEHGTDNERTFCSACGSPIVSYIGAVPELAILKAGTIDDRSWIAPAMEIWARSAHPWSPHFEGAARLQRGPGSEPAAAGV